MPVPSATAAAPVKPSALRRDILNGDVSISVSFDDDDDDDDDDSVKVMHHCRVRALSGPR
jgi:hypothetical protein